MALEVININDIICRSTLMRMSLSKDLFLDRSLPADQLMSSVCPIGAGGVCNCGGGVAPGVNISYVFAEDTGGVLWWVHPVSDGKGGVYLVSSFIHRVQQYVSIYNGKREREIIST